MNKKRKWNIVVEREKIINIGKVPSTAGFFLNINWLQNFEMEYFL